MTYKEYQSAFLNVEKKVKKENDIYYIITELLRDLTTLLFVDGKLINLKWYQIGKIFRIAYIAVRFVEKIVKYFKDK